MPATAPKSTTAKPVDESKHQPDRAGLEDLQEDLGGTEPAGEKKRRPGRPIGAKSRRSARKTGPKKQKPKHAQEPAQEPALEFETIEKFEGKHFTPICKLLFDLIASRLGNHWKLNKGEIAELSVASAELFNKRFPNLAQYSVELNFALVLSAIAYPRLEVVKKK